MQCGNDRQSFLPLNAEDEDTLAAFVNQSDAVHKDTAGSKVSSDAFYAHRDHRNPPLLSFFMKSRFLALSSMVALSFAMVKVDFLISIMVLACFTAALASSCDII